MEQCFLPTVGSFVFLGVRNCLRIKSSLRATEREKEMTECVNNISREVHILEGVCYSCLFGFGIS